MTKENGYQKRDREIKRLRGMIEDCRVDLERLADNEPNYAIISRADLLNWAEKLGHALNKRG